MPVQSIQIAQSALSVGILLATTIYLHRTYRSRCLRDWVVAWALYTLRFGLMALRPAAPGAVIIVTFAEIAHLATAYFLLRGSLELEGRAVPSWIASVLVLSALWATSATAMGLSQLLVTFPTSLAAGAIMIYVGSRYLFRGPEQDDASFGRIMAGGGLLAWGIHKLNYPFLGASPTIAPVGFALAGWLALLVGAGLLMVHLDRLRAAKRRSERHFKAVVHSVNELILTVDANGTVVSAYGGWLERHGIARSQVERKSITGILGTARHDVATRAFREAVRGGVGRAHVQIDLGLGPRWIDFTASPLSDEGQATAHIVVAGRDITEYMEIREALETELTENKSLMMEIHHRVKNNMQVMSSLLNLQSLRMRDADDRLLVEESARRISTMADVHEQLYASRSLSHVAMQPYVTDLAERLTQTYATHGKPVGLRLAIEDIFLDIERALPCAQILHELISNSLKHAFCDRADGTLTVVLREADEQTLVLEVTDDGIGLDQDTRETSEDTLGLNLIELLGRQLNGVSEWSHPLEEARVASTSHAIHALTSGHLGTTFRLRFPKERTNA